MLEEEQRTVIDAGQPCAEPAIVAQRFIFLRDKRLLRLPLHAEGRVRQHIIKRDLLATVAVAETVLGKSDAKPLYYPALTV